MSNWSRKELLDWLNSYFVVDVANIGQLGNGSLYVQILDSLFPGDADLELVNWNADNEFEAMKNIKVLQGSLARHNVRPPPTNFEQLAKGNITENLEFLRFLKTYWDKTFITEEYDPVKRREECISMKRKRSEAVTPTRPNGVQRRPSLSRKGRPLAAEEIPPNIIEGYRQIFLMLDTNGQEAVTLKELMSALGLSSIRTQHSKLQNYEPDDFLTFEDFVELMTHPTTELGPPPAAEPVTAPSPVPSPKPSSSRGRAPPVTPQAVKKPSVAAAARDAASAPSKNDGDDVSKKEIANLKRQLAEEVQISKELEDERDFYYQKLRQIELICQQNQEVSADPELVATILEVLWQPRS